jgi:uncharacterized damage-inducible protein DinB
MTTNSHGKLDFAAQWGRLNDTIIALVDYVPDDKMEWSPREDLWGFRTILSHVSSTRDNWLTPEGVDREGVLATVTSKDDVKERLRESWVRVQRFLSEQRYLDRVYEGSRGDVDYSYSGHWIAFHLLEHDIHHRSDIFHYLALLGVEHPQVETP